MVAAMVILFAIVQTSLHLAGGLVSQYRGEIERIASDILERPVAIDSIVIVWRGFSPVIQMEGVAMLDDADDQPILHLQQLEVQISVISSMLRRQIIPGYIVISGAQLYAKQTQANQLQLTGDSLYTHSAESDPDAQLESQGIIIWLMQQSAIVVRDLTITFEDDTGLQTTIEELNFTFQQYLNHRYRVQGQFTIDQAIPTQIYFDATVRNQSPMSFNWSGDVYLQADQLVIEQWLPEAQGLPQQWQPIYQTLQGQAGIKLWAQLTDNQIDAAQLEFKIDDLAFEQDDQRMPLMNRWSGSLFYERLVQGWSLTGHEIDWHQAVPLSFRYEKNADHYQLQVPEINSAWFAPWLVTEEHLALWHRWQPTGEFTQLTAQWVTRPQQPITHWQVAAQFNDLGWQAVDNIPGVDHLRGQLQASPEKILLQLDSEQVVVNAPTWLEAPLEFIQLQADAHWQREATGWHLSIQHPLVTTDWLTLQGEHWRIHQQEPYADPTLDVHAQVVYFAADQLGRVLPKPLLPPTLYEYLTDFADSGAASGDVWLQGRLLDYPFANGEGELLVDVQVSDVDLTYFEGWPKAEELNGQLIFHNNQMIGRVDSGFVAQNSVDGIQAVLDDLGGRDILTVKGQLPLEPGAAMNFVQASPLAGDLAMLKHLEVYGALDLDLMARIEFLGNQEIDLAVEGALQFAHNQIEFPQWSVDLTDVSGQVNFDAQGIVASHLQAKLWEQPLQLALTTEPADNGYLVLADVQGALDLASLMAVAPWSQMINGQTHYQAQFKFYSDEAAQHQFHWSSDLVGIASHLPAPLHKEQTEVKPIEVTTNFSLDQPIDLQFRIIDLLSGRTWIEFTDNGMRLPHGEIKLGSMQVPLPTENGWQITGYLPALSISAWQAAMTKYMPEGTASNDSSANALDLSTLALIDVTIGQLELAQQTWNDLNIQVHHAAPVWRIDLASEQVEGDIYLTEHYLNGLRANLRYLSLPPLADAATGDWNFSPIDLPPLDLTVEDLYYNNQSLGYLRLLMDVDRDANQVTVEQLAIRNNLAAVVLTGSWREQNQQSITQLKGKLTSTQFTQFLQIIRPKAMLESKLAKIEFDFTWPNKPTQFVLANTEGDFKFKFERGRLTGLEQAVEEKIGLGKMLNILSLQSFWRRLALDFDDLTQKGLGFNVLQGHTHLADGVLSTQDTSLKGSVVYIAAQGEVNLADETYDLTLRVVPYLTGSLPILATFAINPLVGAAAFVADQLVSLGRRETGGTIYQITGSWDEPQIKTP